MKLIRVVGRLILVIAFILAPFAIVAFIEGLPIVRDIVAGLGILFIVYLFNRSWKEATK